MRIPGTIALIAAAILAPTIVEAQAAASWQTTIADKIEAILELPSARRTFWGIEIVDLRVGETVFEHNADKLFLPASNAKLFSTALALRRLGPDYQFTTTVVSDAEPDENGMLDGDLRLVGGGDPNLSARLIPYDRRREYGADRMAPMKNLARQIYEAGLRNVRGDIVGDDSRYVWQPYPPGWSYADTLLSYGSPVSALTFNDNLIAVHVTPGGAAGRAARVRSAPTVEYFSIVNRTTTAAARTVAAGLDIRRGSAPSELVVFGGISLRSRGRTFKLAADDPARYAASALRKELEAFNIEISGDTRSEHLLPDRMPNLISRAAPRRAGPYKFVFAAHTSPPLKEAIRIVNKESQNLHAEMLLREAALHERNIAGVQSTIQEIRNFLKEAGLSPGEYYLRDGSGLSRHNLVTPSGTVKLLAYMWNSPDRKTYIESLPVSGRDGTLDWRFSRTPARGRIFAKTGTMSHVSALSGYAVAADERVFAFSIYANNFGISTSYVRSLIDRIAAAAVTAPPTSLEESTVVE